MLNVLEQLPLHDDACVTALVHVAVQDILTGPGIPSVSYTNASCARSKR